MNKKPGITITALAGRLSDLHFARQMIDRDRHRFAADVPTAERIVGLGKAIAGVERQIAELPPTTPYEADVARLIHARLLGVSAPLAPNDNAVADLTTFCGGHYQTAAVVAQTAFAF